MPTAARVLGVFKLVAAQAATHPVDELGYRVWVVVEGKASGVEKNLAAMLSECTERPVTYAGGVGNEQDLEDLKVYGKGKLDVTVGSALDIFGGTLSFNRLLQKNL